MNYGRSNRLSKPTPKWVPRGKRTPEQNKELSLVNLQQYLGWRNLRDKLYRSVRLQNVKSYKQLTMVLTKQPEWIPPFPGIMQLFTLQTKNSCTEESMIWQLNKMIKYKNIIVERLKHIHSHTNQEKSSSN